MNNKSNEFKIIRKYNSPIKTVWNAWVDSDQVAKWWGPRGFSITNHSKDLKIGGHWSYTMHGPDGTDYPNRTFYHEVKPYSRLVYDHGASENTPPLFRVTAVFKELNPSETQLEMTMACETAEAAEQIQKFIKQANGNSTWDRFAEYLEFQKNKKIIFVINRSFSIPLEKMFQIWTEPKHVTQWLSPTGTEMNFLKGDIRTDGRTFYKMWGKDMTLFGKAHYLKIESPHALIYTQEFCDENEKTIRHPMAPIWPETMLTTVNLTSEGSEKTRVMITWEPYGKFTPEENQFFAEARPGMTMGWTGSFDKLEDYIESINVSKTLAT